MARKVACLSLLEVGETLRAYWQPLFICALQHHFNMILFMQSIESIINMAKQKESEPHSSEEEESVALDSYTLQQLLRRPTESLSSFFPRRAP